MENRLREIIVSVTHRCNLKCAMCQIPLNDVEEMNTSELKELISDAARLNPNSFVFSGGEPLLRKDIFELISFANQYKINTCLTSNGTIINIEVAKQLADSGIGVVNISIEGPEDIHDLLRGSGNFKKAVEALKNLSYYKIETTIAAVVCRQNYSSLPYIMELAHQFGVTTVKFQPFNEMFLIKKEEKENFFALQSEFEEIKQSIEQVKELSKKYRITTNPDNYLDIIPLYLTSLWSNSYHNPCSSLLNSCPISADGNVYLCWALSDRVLGNVKKTKFSQIWNSDEHNRLRELVSREGCSGCLMSCYDYNFGGYNLPQVLSLKAKKFTKPKFYKRQYYRIHQYLRYIFKKILNRIVNLNLFYRRDNPELAATLEEIKIAKDILKKANLK